MKEEGQSDVLKLTSAMNQRMMKHSQVRVHVHTVESGYLAHALIGITAKLYAPHSEVR